MKRKFLTFVLTGFGSGTVPVAPGTAGSTLALLIVLPIWFLPWFRPSLYLYSAALLFALFLVSTVVCRLGDSHIQERWGESDPGEVVLDEFSGVFLVSCLLFDLRDPLWLLAGFVSFRIFDMLKPVPVHLLESENSWSDVAIDDVAAAVIAACITRVFFYLTTGL